MPNGKAPRSEIEAIFQARGQDPLASALDQIGVTLSQSLATRRQRQAIEAERQADLESFTREAELKRELQTIKDRNKLLREEAKAQREREKFDITETRLESQFNEQQRRARAAEALRREELELRRQRAVQPRRPTQQQFIAATFANRVVQSEQVFQNIRAAGFDPTTVRARIQRRLPEALKSEFTKLQEQAERNFVNAILRRESGAAIAASEFESAENQYFPRVGDSLKVLEQKRQNRQIVLQGLQAEARGILPPLLVAPGSIKEAQQGLEEKVNQLPGLTQDEETELQRLEEKLRR